MKVTIKEQKKPSRRFNLKHMQKNEGLYYNEDNDIYVLSVMSCFHDSPKTVKNTLIYISNGSIIETLDAGAWEDDEFTLSPHGVLIANQTDENE